MLRPYSWRAPPRPRCAVDAWTAGWTLLERHQARVAAPPAIALAALAALRIRELPAVRSLFALRRLRFAPEMTLRELFGTRPFVALAEEPGRELVAGVLVAGRDGFPDGRGAPDSAAGFRAALSAAPFAAIVTFRADALAPGGSLLWTETWARTRGRGAALAFGAYWLAVGPWSAWIRRMFLRAARDRAERAAAGAHGGGIAGGGESGA